MNNHKICTCGHYDVAHATILEVCIISGCGCDGFTEAVNEEPPNTGLQADLGTGHVGNPCIYCGQVAGQMQSGECPSR